MGRENRLVRSDLGMSVNCPHLFFSTFSFGGADAMNTIDLSDVRLSRRQSLVKDILEEGQFVQGDWSAVQLEYQRIEDDELVLKYLSVRIKEVDYE